MSIRVLAVILLSLASSAHAQCYAVGTMHSFGGLNGVRSMREPGACDAAATPQRQEPQRQTTQTQAPVRQPAPDARR